MSAIWGAIDLSGNSIDDRIVEQMRRPFDKCVIDRYEQFVNDNVYMGCGIQYFTREARHENLPIDNGNIYFDADVIIDNRDELLKILKEDNNIPDGEILFRMYDRFGKKCLNRLLGAYSFVYYDKTKKEVSAVIDAVGDRCLYYFVEKNIFYYSTLIEPLKRVKENVKVNGRWAADFLAMDHLYMFDEAEETPVDGIYRVAPAQIVTVTIDDITKKTYWNPFKDYSELKYKTDDEYKAEFRRVFDEAVGCVLRSDKETSVLLSGGLDSTSVACVAAKELEKRGEILHSYTSVPKKNYSADTKGYYLEDETEAVLKTKEYIPNLECVFVDMPKSNSWDDRHDEISAIEMPYKSVQNLLWICESLKQAYANGSRMMLTGSFGNTTISFANLEIYINTLFQKMHYVTLYKELTAFQKQMGFSRKYAIKQTIKESISSKKKNNDKYNYGNSYVNMDAVEKYGTEKRLLAMNDKLDYASKNHDRYRRMMLDKKSFRQIGEISTKHSLATGVILRDPTKDKRVIEYCLRVPVQIFATGGVERRLVREYLKGVVPDHVINSKQKGKQSADLKFRIMENEERIIEEWRTIYRNNPDNEFVDSKKALKDLENVKTVKDLKQYDIVRHIYTASMVEYLNESF